MTVEQICKSARHFVRESGAVRNRSDVIRTIIGSPSLPVISGLAREGEELPNAQDLKGLVYSVPFDKLQLTSGDAVGRFVRSCLSGKRQELLETAVYNPGSVSNTVLGKATKNTGKSQFRITISYPNLCWLRFISCKELMHVHYDMFDNTDISSDAFRKGTDPIMEHILSRRTPVCGEELKAETSAFYLAIETMIPWEIRGQLHRLLDVLDPKEYKHPVSCIAKAFMIPEFVFYHILDSKYLDLSDKVNRAIDA